MNAFERRKQIVEHMKLCKFDTLNNLIFEFVVSRRTMINDITELSVNGYPIIAEPGNGSDLNQT